MNLILRKVRGIAGLTPLWRPASGSFGSAAAPSAVFAAFFSRLAVGIVLFAFLLAWFIAVPHVAHATEIRPETLAPIMAMGSLATQLRDAEEKIAEKSKSMHDIFEKAGSDVDFAHKDVLQLTGKSSSKEVVEHVKALNDELADLGRKRDEVVQLKKIQDENDARRTRPATPLTHPEGNGGGTQEQKRFSFGEVIVKSRAFLEGRKNKGNYASEEEGFGLAELKATFLTSSGWTPESTRTGLVVEKATRPLQVIDIIPALKTDMAAVKYMEETTRTHAGAERAENASYAESSFVLTERSETVRSIGESVPVTDEQLEDVSAHRATSSSASCSGAANGSTVRS
jgi:hypothetical protein